MNVRITSAMLYVLLVVGLVESSDVIFEQDSKQPVDSGLMAGNNTICPDESQCLAGHTCCPRRLHYVCCPYLSGTCCADQLHCCPMGSRCDPTSRMCLHEPTSQGYQPMPVTAAVDQNPPTEVGMAALDDGPPNTICPDGSHCATGHTCCPHGRRYSCCRYNSGTCCADQRTCCQHGCRCDLLRSRCVCGAAYPPFLQMAIPASRPKSLPSVERPTEPEKTAEIKDTVCPDGSHCPTLHTCCPRGGHYACCRYNSGTCCADQNFCCPHNYRCDLHWNRCVRDTAAFPAIFQRPARVVTYN